MNSPPGQVVAGAWVGGSVFLHLEESSETRASGRRTENQLAAWLLSVCGFFDCCRWEFVSVSSWKGNRRNEYLLMPQIEQ